MILRPFKISDQADYLAQSKKFYKTPAVVHDIPEEYMQRTFDEALKGSPLMTAYALSETEESPMKGYLLISFSWNNEAGGPVLWLEELYLEEEIRGQGWGRFVLTEIIKKYKNQIKRFRLEVSPANQIVIALYERCGFQKLDYLQYCQESE